jgi:Secretion system C-terminal sorting domain
MRKLFSILMIIGITVSNLSAQCSFLQSDSYADVDFSAPACVGTPPYEYPESKKCISGTTYTKYYIANPVILCGDPLFNIFDEDTNVDELTTGGVSYTRINASGTPISTGNRIKVDFNRPGNFRIRARWNCGLYTEYRDMVVKIASSDAGTNINPARFNPYTSSLCPSPNTNLTIVRSNPNNPIEKYSLNIREWNRTTNQPGLLNFDMTNISGNMKQVTPSVPANFFVAGKSYKITLSTTNTICSNTAVVYSDYLTIQGAPANGVYINGSATPAVIKPCQPIVLDNYGVNPVCAQATATASFIIKNNSGVIVAQRSNVPASTYSTYDLIALFPNADFVRKSGSYGVTVTNTNSYGTTTATCAFETNYIPPTSANFSGGLVPCGALNVTPLIAASAMPCGTNTINITVVNNLQQTVLTNTGAAVYSVPYSTTPINVANFFPIDRGATDTYGITYYVTNSNYPDPINRTTVGYAAYANYTTAVPTTNFTLNGSTTTPTLFSCQTMTLGNSYLSPTCANETRTLRMQLVGGTTTPAITVPLTTSYNLKTLFPTQTATQGTYEITLFISNKFGTSTTKRTVNVAIQLVSNANFTLVQYKTGPTPVILQPQTVFSPSNTIELGGRYGQINFATSNPGVISKYKVEVWEVNGSGFNLTVAPLLKTTLFAQDGFVPVTVASPLPGLQNLNFLYTAQNTDDYFNTLSEADRAAKKFRIVFTVNNICGDVASFSYFKIRENCPNCRLSNSGNHEEKVEVLSVADNSLLTATVYPNPAVEALEIAYNLPTETLVSIRIFDVFGKEVTAITPSMQNMGNHTEHISITEFAKGVYFYTLETNTDKISGKFIKQ